MGQLLGIGLVTTLAVSQKKLQKCGVTIEECVEQMKQRFYFEPALYELSLDEDYYNWTLKTDILESQLVPFLESLYPMLYKNTHNFEETLKVLQKQTTTQQFLELADSKDIEEFQLNEYGESDYIYFAPSKQSIGISYTSILLSHEGKIGMEVYGRQFAFFQYCIQKAFADFSLVKALRVYISG